MTFVSKVLQFQAIGHAPRWSISSQRDAECSQEENGFLIHQKMQEDGAMAHGSTSTVPKHISLMSSVPFQENYTCQIQL